MAQTMLPASLNEINNKKAFAFVATLMPDGTPQVTPVWYDVVGNRIRINSAKGRVKDKNMRANAAVAVSISDPENPYRHVSVRGKVVNITEEGADAHIDALARKYTGKDYAYRQPGEVRVIYEIEPVSVSSMG